jgi:phosphoglycerate-specific signal transduction histidine kinase
LIVTLGFDNNNVPIPKKIVDTMGKVGRVKLQVLDGSTVFLEKNRDALISQINNLTQGLQLVQTDRQYSDWVVGELWAVGNVNNATLAVLVEIMPDRAGVPEIRGAEGGDCLPCGESLE